MITTDLRTLKADMSVLLAELQLGRQGHHGACIFCGSSDALSTWTGDDGACFHCKSCGTGGDVIRAVALKSKISNGAAIKLLTGEQYKPQSRPPITNKTISEPIPPTPNDAKLQAIFEQAFQSILDSRADDAIRRRGLSKPWLLRSPNLGYFPADQAWVIRVALPDGVAVALKLHRDRPQDGQPKSQWLRLGTLPADQPRHGFSCLWPPVEWYSADPLFIAEGELKAAALISAGFSATAPTTGSGFKWTPANIARVAGRHVVVVFDQDDAGNKFRLNTVVALTGAAKSIKEITFTETDLERTY